MLTGDMASDTPLLVQASWVHMMCTNPCHVYSCTSPVQYTCTVAPHVFKQFQSEICSQCDSWSKNCWVIKESKMKTLSFLLFLKIFTTSEQSSGILWRKNTFFLSLNNIFSLYSILKIVTNKKRC